MNGGNVVDGVDRTNYGMILTGTGEPDPAEPYTVIVSGVARSGTSMIATILHAAGVPMGNPPLDVVIEDPEIFAAAQSGHAMLLREIIARRDAASAIWGFKMPNMHAYLHADQITWFRNPRMILIFRDPIAVSVRESLSEYFDPRNTLASSLHGMLSTVAFAEQARCPTLMLSYEKSIAAPERAVRAVLSFCGLRVGDAMVADLVRMVQPDNPAYLRTANSHFVGYVDQIVDGHLTGWCREVNKFKPVTLDLIANDQILTTFVAMEFRQDLARKKIGNGNHGFRLAIDQFNLSPDTVLRIRPTKRVIELSGSGQTIRQLAAIGRTNLNESGSLATAPIATQAPAIEPEPLFPSPFPSPFSRGTLGSW